MRMLSFLVMFAVVMFLINVLVVEPPDKPEKTTPPAATTGGGDGFEPPIRRSQKWLDEQAAKGEEWAEDELALHRQTARRNSRFDKRVLSGVKDNTLGIRHDESDAFFRLLDHANRVSPTDLELAAATDVQYLNLMTEPSRFRGDLITIQGELWRLYDFPAGPNNHGFTKLYEAWVITSDSAQRPYRIVCANLPRSLSPGDNKRRTVRVNGYFFKREGYSSPNGVHVAPTLLAATVTPVLSATAIPLSETEASVLTGVVTAVGLALLVTLLAIAFGERRVKRMVRQQQLNEPMPSFARVEFAPAIPVEQSLREFAEKVRQTELTETIAATGLDAGTVANTVLYRRDPHATVPPPIPSESSIDDELDSRRVLQANVLQNWTARKVDSDTEKLATPTDKGQREREQNVAQQVLNRLEVEEAESDEGLEPNLPNSDGTVYSLDKASVTKPKSVVESPGSEAQEIAREQLERDRLKREHELRQHLSEQRDKLEQQRKEQGVNTTPISARDAVQTETDLPKSHIEIERHAKPEANQPQAGPERLTFDRADRESTPTERSIETETPSEDVGPPPKPHGWSINNLLRARQRRDRYRRDGA